MTNIKSTPARRRSGRFSNFIGSAKKLHVKNSAVKKRRNSKEFSKYHKKFGILSSSIPIMPVGASNDITKSMKSSNSANTNNQNVKVVARLRPLSTKEKNENSMESIKALSNEATLTLSNNPKDKESEKRRFEYDAVFGQQTTQKEVYEKSAGELIRDNIFKGFNVTILAYGQTGSGKTFTMGTEGSDIPESKENDTGSPENNNSSTIPLLPPREKDGVIPRAVYDIFKIANTIPNRKERVSIQMSYLEIYNEEIRDLLSSDNGGVPPELSIRDTKDGVVVPKLSLEDVKSPKHVSDLMKTAAVRRATASTAMNAVSSRSHAICTLHVIVKASDDEDEDNEEIRAKLTLVDLAGSERIKRTGAEGARMKEGININKGLFVLGQVVSALSEMGQRDNEKGSMHSHIPYRDSKLTRLLQDSLGGNSRTVMIACVSPAHSNLDESTNTLRYATRTRNIKNVAIKNVVATTLSAVEAAALRKENQLLKLQVFQLQTKINSSDQGSSGSNISSTNIASEQNTIDQSTLTNGLSMEKLELVTQLKANVVSLEGKMDHLQEKLNSANDEILQASIRGDKWQNQYETLSRWAKDNQIKLPEENKHESENVILELRNEVQRLKSQLQESQGDAAVARATAAAVIKNNGDLQAVAELDLSDDLLMIQNLDHEESELNIKKDKLTSDLIAINNDIELKEAMAMQTNKEREAMDSLRSHFEDAIKTLEEEVGVLTSERHGLIEKMKKLEKNRSGKASDEPPELKKMRAKLSELEQKMKVLKKKSAEHTKSLRLREMAEKKCEQLAREITENKKKRASLQKKLKEESVERRTERKAAQLQAMKIMRDKQKLVMELNKVKETAAKQAIVLKRKAMESLNRQKSKAEKEKKRNNAAALRNMAAGDVSTQKKNELIQWLDYEIQSLTMIKDTRDQIDEQNFKLERALSKKAQLQSKLKSGDNDASIQNAIDIIEKEMSSRKSIIKQLENNINEIYKNNSDKSSVYVDNSTWNSFNKNEMKFLHGTMFDRFIDLKHDSEKFRIEHAKIMSKAINDEVFKEKRKSEDLMLKMKMQHSEDMMSLLESTKGAVERNVMIKVLENSDSAGVEPSIQTAVDDLLKSYMEGCHKIGKSVRRELKDVRKAQDGMKEVVDQVAINLGAKTSITRKKYVESEQVNTVLTCDDKLNAVSDDSDVEQDVIKVPDDVKESRTINDNNEEAHLVFPIHENTTNVIVKDNLDEPGEPLLDFSYDKPSDDAIVEEKECTDSTLSSNEIKQIDNGNSDTDETENESIKDNFEFDETMKVSELKDILRKRGLKVAGKKSELLKRLRSPRPSDWSKSTKRSIEDSSKENVPSDLVIYSEKEKAIEANPLKRSKRNMRDRDPLQHKVMNELEIKQTQEVEPIKSRQPEWRPTKTNSLAGDGAERRRNLANALKASLKEAEMML